MKIPHVSGLKRVSGIATSVGQCDRDTPLAPATGICAQTDVLLYMVMPRPPLSERRRSIWHVAQERFR